MISIGIDVFKIYKYASIYEFDIFNNTNWEWNFTKILRRLNFAQVDYRVGEFREIPFSPPKMTTRFSPLFGLRFKKINFSGDFGILIKKSVVEISVFFSTIFSTEPKIIRVLI